MSELNLAVGPTALRPYHDGGPRHHAPASVARQDYARRAPAAEAGAEALRGQTARAASTLTEQSYSVDLRQTQSLQLEIVTAEGDTVTLTLADERAAQLAGYQGAGATGTVAAAGATLSTRGNFSYTVEGELSAEESTAIDDLLRRVDELAGRFFSGDIDGLLKQAGGLDLDLQALASFSLQMDLTQSVQATTAYRTVQAMTAEGAKGAAPSSTDLPTFVSDVGAARSASAEYKNLFDELLRSAVQLLQAARTPELSAADATVTDTSAVTLLDQLLSALEAATETSMTESMIDPDVEEAVESAPAA